MNYVNLLNIKVLFYSKLFYLIYALYPLDALLPLALSNFLPFDLTNGLVVDPGSPGALPKCFLASLILEPLKRTTFSPFGLFKAN